MWLGMGRSQHEELLGILLYNFYDLKEFTLIVDTFNYHHFEPLSGGREMGSLDLTFFILCF